MTSPRVFYLTTPIYYVNARPHLGHAYTTIGADAMCRYRRLAGDRVHFLTGTDEHGDKIAQAAAKAAQSPQAYTDTIASAFRDTWQRLGISNDDFIRTTEARHVAIVQAILRQLHAAGELYFGTYGGLYCFGCERFYTEKEALEGQCPQHQTPLTFIEEENYFFRMSKYQDWLIAEIEARPNLIRPERYRNEVLGFLREPLQDLSISRPKSRLEWGIPLPFDDRFVTYVWFDALINYVSALGGPGDPRFAAFWPHACHLIGKDILKPHGIYWPCMLKAAGLPIYQALHVHGYWNLAGGKMSKSLGNVVEAFRLTDTYGHDAFRYFLMRDMTFGLDATFSEGALVGRLNADLANDLGNLVSRATTMFANFAGGVVPAVGDPGPAAGIVRKTLARTRAEVDTAMSEFAFQRALGSIWEFIRIVNGFIDAVQPWALARDPTRRLRLEGALYTLAESLRCLAILLDAFLPDTAVKIRSLFGLDQEPLVALEWGGIQPGTKVTKATALFPRVEVAAPAPAGIAPLSGRGPEPDSTADTQGDQVAGQTPEQHERGRGAATSAVDPARPAIPGGAQAASLAEASHRPSLVAELAPGTSEGGAGRVPVIEFAKLELRVAAILAADAVAKSKKLLKLTVDLGEGGARTIVAGIAEHYSPSELVGKKVVVVANLEPARLMGIESNGMLLAGSADGKLAVLALDRDLPTGARVR